jgi:hypothetical protein
MTAEPITQEKAPAFKAVPIAEIPQDAKPDTAPKRGRKPRDPNAPKRTYTRRKSGSLEQSIGAALITANLPLMMFATNDALDAAEITALSKAIDSQCQQSPQFRKYVETALNATSGGGLIVVIGMIGARRLARHGILLPKAADDQIGAVLSGDLSMLSQLPVTEPEEPSANGTGSE